LTRGRGMTSAKGGLTFNYMEKILFNLALIDTLNFCKANGINPSGSHLVKYPRRWTYALCRDTDGQAIVTVTFYKNQEPTHFIHKH